MRHPRGLWSSSSTSQPTSAAIRVQLFFALSGFLITGILLDTRRAPRAWSAFYMRRAMRILPLCYATLLVAFAMAPLVGRPISASSYAFYMFRVPIANYLRDLLRIDVWSVSPLRCMAERTGFFVLGAAASFGAALVSYHLFEKRFLDLKRHSLARPEPA